MSDPKKRWYNPGKGFLKCQQRAMKVQHLQSHQSCLIKYFGFASSLVSFNHYTQSVVAFCCISWYKVFKNINF